MRRCRSEEDLELCCSRLSRLEGYHNIYAISYQSIKSRNLPHTIQMQVSTFPPPSLLSSPSISLLLLSHFLPPPQLNLHGPQPSIPFLNTPIPTLNDPKPLLQNLDTPQP